MSPVSKKAKEQFAARAAKLVSGQPVSPASISKGLIQALAENVSHNKVAEVINGLLKAEKVVSLGHGESRTQPDWAAREAGAKLFLSYIVGLPVQRQEVVTVQHETMETIQEKLEISPAFRKALRDLLDQCEKKVGAPSPPVTPNPQ